MKMKRAKQNYSFLIMDYNVKKYIYDSKSAGFIRQLNLNPTRVTRRYTELITDWSNLFYWKKKRYKTRQFSNHILNRVKNLLGRCGKKVSSRQLTWKAFRICQTYQMYK